MIFVIFVKNFIEFMSFMYTNIEMQILKNYGFLARLFCHHFLSINLQL